MNKFLYIIIPLLIGALLLAGFHLLYPDSDGDSPSEKAEQVPPRHYPYNFVGPLRPQDTREVSK